MAGKKKTAGWKKLTAGAILVTSAVITGQWMATTGELVTEVLDGDSFKLANKQTIRLASLNAPPLEYCYGQEAKNALTAKILNKRVILKAPQTDLYGRILALVYVRGQLVNEYLIKNGFASSTREAGEETAAVKAANDYARTNQLGVFSPLCTQTEPPNPKCPIKGNLDDRTKEKKYFLPACQHYSKVIVKKSFGDDWFCSEAEAQKAGYEKAKDCPPLPNTPQIVPSFQNSNFEN